MQPDPLIPIPGGLWGALGAAIAGGLTWFAARRMRNSAEDVTLAEDKARVDTTRLLREERDQHAARADAADARGDALAAENAKLKAELSMALRDFRQLQRDVRRLRDFAPPEVREFVETNFASMPGELGEPER